MTDMNQMAAEYNRYVDAVEARRAKIRAIDDEIFALHDAFILHWAPFKDGDVVVVERGRLRDRQCRVVRCKPVAPAWIGQPDEYIDGVPHWDVTLEVLRKDGELDRTYSGTQVERLVWLPNKRQYTGMHLAEGGE